MAVRMLWLVMGCALGGCSGHTSSSSGPTAEGGANAMPKPNRPEPAGPSEAGESSGPSAAGSGAGGVSIGSGGEDTRGGQGAAAAGNEGGETSQGGVGSGGETAIEFPPRGVCGPAVNEYSKRYCSDLSRLSFRLEAIEDAGGDGSVSPGEEGRMVFVLHNPGPEPFLVGPCVGVLGATPGLTVLEPYNPSAQLFGVAAGRESKMKLRFRVEPGVVPGSLIPLVAWLDVQAAHCPNGDDLRFDLLIAP